MNSGDPQRSTRVALLWLVSGLLAGPALAAPAKPAPFRPLKIEAKVYREDGPRLSVVSETSTRRFALSADGSKLIYIDAAGLWVATKVRGKPRRIDGPAPYFRMSPDASYVLVPGSPWTRLSASGRDGPVEVGYPERAHQLSGVAMSKHHVAFITADGPLAVASLREGNAVRMPVALPEDRRCHAGAGFPRGLSTDGRWMIFQHGCAGNDLIRTDGSGRRSYKHVNSLFVDDYLVGSKQHGSGEVEVIHLSSQKQWRVPGISLGQGLVRVPGRLALMQLDARQRLVLIDLQRKTVRTLHEGDGRVTGHTSVTTDGKRGLYATQHDKACAVHQVDLHSGQRQQLARVENTRQCLIYPLGARRAVLYTWSSHPSGQRQAIVATIDLESAVVTRLGPVINDAGSLQTAGQTIALAVGQLLYMARP